MRVIAKELIAVNQLIKAQYLHHYCKTTGEYRIHNGCLNSVFDTLSIRIGMVEKIDRANKALRLSAKHKKQSIDNANIVLNALNILEGKQIEICYPNNCK